MNKDNRTDAEEAAANVTKGIGNQVKGRVKEAIGDLTGDSSTKWEGKRDRVKGRLQEEYGEVKEKESDLERDLNDIDRNRV